MTEDVIRIDTIRGIRYEVRTCGNPSCENGRVRDVTMLNYCGSDGKVSCSRCSGLGVQYRRIYEEAE